MFINTYPQCKCISGETTVSKVNLQSYVFRFSGKSTLPTKGVQKTAQGLGETMFGLKPLRHHIRSLGEASMHVLLSNERRTDSASTISHEQSSSRLQLSI